MYFKDKAVRVGAGVAIAFVGLALALLITLWALSMFAGVKYNQCVTPTDGYGKPTLIVDGQPVVVCSDVWKVL